MSSVRWHFFVFCNSVEKFCISWAFPLIECVAVWALQPPVPHTDVLKTHSSQSFSTELQEYKGTGSEHLSQTRHSKLSFLYHLINASRNIFLDALVAAFINGTWPLINSTYQFLFPDNSFCHGFLQALYRRLSEPHRFVSNVCCRFLCIPVIPQINFVTRRYKHVGMRLAYFACPYPYAFVKRECPRDAKFICGITGIQKKCQQHLTQTNLKIYWKIHCESTILDIYESKLAK